MPILPLTISMAGDDVPLLLTSDSPAVWSTDVGNLYIDAAGINPYSGTERTSIYFKPFNRTTRGVVVAGASEAIVTVVGVLPQSPHYPMEWEGERRGVVASVSRAGRVRGRIIGDAKYSRDYKLIFDKRKPSEVAELEEFHDYHYPDKIFIYRNKWHQIDGIFRFDSKIKGRAESRAKGVVEVAIAQVTETLGVPGGLSGEAFSSVSIKWEFNGSID